MGKLVRTVSQDIADWTLAPRWILVTTILVLIFSLGATLGWGLSLFGRRIDRIESQQREVPTRAEAELSERVTAQGTQVRILTELITQQAVEQRAQRDLLNELSAQLRVLNARLKVKEYNNGR